MEKTTTINGFDFNNNEKIDGKYWQKCYSAKYTRWQLNDAHELLVNNVHLLELTKPAKIFVPFCGKSVDIKWLYSQGYNVLSAEIVEDAVIEQFRMCNVAYTVTQVSNDLTVYESVDKRVKILKCDFLKFDCSKYEKTIEAVWDRASMFALEPEDQRRYAIVMKKLLKPKFSYLIQTVMYDESKMKGPPFCVDREKLEDCFGDIANIRQFEDYYQESMCFGSLTSFYAFHLTNKE